MNCDEWLKQKYAGEFFSGNLEDLRKACGGIVTQISQSGVKIVTIAGTNGKGQTSFDLYHLITRSGHSCLLWTSPHVKTVRERFQFNGAMISEAELWRLIKKVETDFANKRLSYYEFLFVVLCYWILERRPQYLVLEVGMGGRLDAVNLFDAILILIPSISRDHQEFLGTTYLQILREKLGVCRPNCQLYTTFKLEWLRQNAEHYAQELKFDYQDLIKIGVIAESTDYFESNRQLALWGYLNITNSTPSDSQLREKFASAKGPALTMLENYRPGLGRLEEIEYQGKRIVLNGSHNIDGHRKLLDHYRKRKLTSGTFDSVLMAFSRRPAEEVAWIIKLYWSARGELFKKLLITSFDHPKAMPREEVRSILLGLQKDLGGPEQPGLIEDWKGFFSDSKQVQGPCLVTGSYYFIGECELYFARLADSCN